MSQRRLVVTETTHDSNSSGEEEDVQDNAPRSMSWPNRNFIGFWFVDGVNRMNPLSGKFPGC